MKYLLCYTTDLMNQKFYVKPSCFFLQKTQESAIRLHDTAYKLLEARHYDSERIQAIASSNERKWQQLIMQSEDRRKLFQYAASFYKTSEQVSDCGKMLLLDSF